MNIKKKYILFIVTMIATIIMTILTIPKVRIIEDCKNKAINPIDKQIVEMDKYYEEIQGLSNMKNYMKNITENKSLISTVAQLAIFDNSTFSDVFEYVLLTSIAYIVLVCQNVWLLIKSIKESEDKWILILLSVIFLVSILFGAYFIGILAIMIIAIVTGVVGIFKG